MSLLGVMGEEALRLERRHATKPGGGHRLTVNVVADVTGGDVFMWLLPGILCVVGILILLTIDIVWCVNIDDWVGSGDEWYVFLKGGGIKLWLCIGSAFISFFLGKYAFYRLIVNNQPPEIELKD